MEARKRRIWESRAEEWGKEVVVVPCVMETTGAFGEELVAFVHMIAGATKMGPTGSALMQQLSVAMQKCNAVMMEEAIRRRRC